MKQITLSIPGKVMLGGEYAVLKHGHALAVTVDCAMTIEITHDEQAPSWEVHSSLWDEPREVLDFRATQLDPLCRAVQMSAKRNNLLGGIVKVASNINVQDGLGSSSALRLGISAGMNILAHGRDPTRPSGVHPECLQHAWVLQSEAQGLASGYDITTQYVGGVVEFSFDYDNHHWHPHWFRHNLESLQQFVHVFVGGLGSPTAATVQTTTSWLESGIRADRLMDASEALVDSFIETIRFYNKQNLRRLISTVPIHRNLFIGSPHFPQHLADLLLRIPGCDRSWTWKTTGAGGEDAILLIGTATDIQKATFALNTIGWRPLTHKFTAKGISLLPSSSALLDTNLTLPSQDTLPEVTL